MSTRQRPYIYYDVAISVCATCYRKLEGKIVFQDDKVFLLKRCAEHGAQKVLLSDDIAWYRRCREDFMGPAEMPVKFQTPVRWGCPYDCGLCSDHEQHSCLTLVEICDACNLTCPICYADSSPKRQSYRTLEQVERMLDAVVASEGEPDVVQISGGEPTLHPQFFEILDAAKARPIRHLMLNTNGLRIAREDGFAERLAAYAPGFEIYLQFDSLQEDALRRLRGADLRKDRARAIERLDALNLSTTLVVTVARGVNDDELGAIIDYALEHRCVRGITFQPVQEAGRVEAWSPEERITLAEVRRKLLAQTDLFDERDILPVPCHPDALAMAYALKVDGEVIPLTRQVDDKTLLEGAGATITFERGAELVDAPTLSDLLCCLPKAEAPATLGYENLFRIILMEFLDAHSLDVRSVKRSCVHIVHPDDGRLIPFDTYNLFYRDGLEQERLAPLRAELDHA